jgi:peptidoglycan/LPS O-acetylase OafA/YrhL
MSNGTKKPRLRRYWPRLLFLVPFVAMLFVSSYNRIAPDLGGIPFFYWYQLAWILLGAAIVLVVYAIETKVTRVTERTEREAEPSGVPGDIL